MGGKILARGFQNLLKGDAFGFEFAGKHDPVHIHGLGNYFEEAARAKMLNGAGLVDGFPGAQQYVCHDEGRFDAVFEVFLLCRRQIGAQVWNDAVVTSEDAVLCTQGIGLAAAHIGDLDPAVMIDGMDDRAV